MSFNDLTSTTLSVGQILKIPLFITEPTETIHTVVAGDTLFNLANRFNTTVDAIMRLNNLTSTSLTIGQQLRIPGAGVVPPQPPPPPSRPTIRQGDRGEDVRELQRLLTNLGFNPGPVDGIFGNGTANAVRAFQRANNLNADGIVGPLTWTALYAASTPQETTYTVVAGDTLFSIARRFNTSVEAITTLNNLTSPNLTIGQQLRIPGGVTPGPRTHTVVAGDTLFNLANRFNTTVDAIVRLNNLPSTILSIGQVLQIPS